jgi:hypothetical protein
LDALLTDLEKSQRRIADMLLSMANRQEWRPAPGEWSYRFVAAHLAAAERECFLERIIRIAMGTNPRLDYYLDTDRNFSGHDLRDSVEAWRVARRAVFAFVRSLTDNAWTFTGRHVRRGPITIADVLRDMLDHDHEHLAELERRIALISSGRS